MKTKTEFPNKPFEMISSLLSLPRKKEKQPSPDKMMVDKASLTLITQILGHSSSSQARKILESLGNLVYTAIKDISKAKNPQYTMIQFLQTHRSTQERSIFNFIFHCELKHCF